MTDAPPAWRIAMLDPGDFTPPYDEALADGLIGLGQEIRLFGMVGGNLFPKPAFHREHFYALLARDGLRGLPSWTTRPLKGVCHVLDMRRIVEVLKAFRPDVIHAQWLPLPLVDRLALRPLRRLAPFVLTVHDSNPYQGAAGLLMRSGYGPLMRTADAVIVHTSQALDRLRGIGVDAQRLHRVPHGLLHASAGAPMPRPRQGDGRLVLLQFGKIKAYKGVDVLLQALARLPPALRDRFEVRIVGQPYLDTAPLTAFVTAHGLDGVVRFRFGFVDPGEMRRHFAEADAVLFPYRDIDASGVAMTAVAHGLPVLASAIGMFREQFADGREARLVPPGDPEALARVLETWVRCPKSLEALARGMRDHRAKVPSWENVARRTLGVYAEARRNWYASAANVSPLQNMDEPTSLL